MMRRSLTQQRAAFARQAVEEAMQQTSFTHYAMLVSSLPLLLHRHGLGQTLSYLRIRGGDRERSPYLVLYRQLTERLNAVFSLRDSDLLNSITRMGSPQYLRLSMEAYAYALALRRAVNEARANREDAHEAEDDEE